MSSKKFDQGKPHVYSVLRYFPRALEQVARVNEHGAKLHGWNTWSDIPDASSRYADAQLRHELAQCQGILHDTDSKLLHQAHIVWNALARLELMLKNQENK